MTQAELDAIVERDRTEFLRAPFATWLEDHEPMVVMDSDGNQYQLHRDPKTQEMFKTRM